MATKAIKRCGNWNVRVQEFDAEGKRHYKSFTAPTKKEAEYLAAQYEYGKKRTEKPSEMTVGETVDGFISLRNSVLSPTTIREYKRIRKIYLGSIEYVKLSDITNIKLQAHINTLASDHSPKTVRNVWALIAASIKQYHPDFTPKIDLPNRVKKEIQIPKKTDIAKLMDTIKNSELEKAVLLAAGYGLRRGEICALTYQDIDSESNTIRINKSLARDEHNDWVLKSPKSYAGTRTISVSPVLIERLAKNRSSITQVVRMTPDKITYNFHLACQKAGISCRFHDLRHYNASIMLAMSVPDKYAMERLGQSTPGMLKGVYQHIIDERMKQVNDAINAEFEAFSK